MYYTERKLFFDGEYLALHASNVFGFLQKVVEYKTSDGLAECFLKRNCTALNAVRCIELKIFMHCKKSSFQTLSFTNEKYNKNWSENCTLYCTVIRQHELVFPFPGTNYMKNSYIYSVPTLCSSFKRFGSLTQFQRFLHHNLNTQRSWKSGLQAEYDIVVS